MYTVWFHVLGRELQQGKGCLRYASRCCETETATPMASFWSFWESGYTAWFVSITTETTPPIGHIQYKLDQINCSPSHSKHQLWGFNKEHKSGLLKWMKWFAVTAQCLCSTRGLLEPWTQMIIHSKGVIL